MGCNLYFDLCNATSCIDEVLLAEYLWVLYETTDAVLDKDKVPAIFREDFASNKRI